MQYRSSRHGIDLVISFSPVNADLSGWLSGNASPFTIHGYDARIRPVIASLVDSLHAAGAEASEDNSPSRLHRAVDLMSTQVQRLLDANLDPNTSSVRSELIDLLLNGYASDGAVDTLPERQVVDWCTSVASSLGVAPFDLRRSLHNFLSVRFFLLVKLLEVT